MNADTIERPGFGHALAELGLAPLELGSHFLSRPLLSRLPKGDGHVVLVLPGFLASDASTGPMRKVLSDLGYCAYGWGLGRNLRYNHQREQEIDELVHRRFTEQGRPISVVGWSLGGIIAREISKRYPEYVRMVISLGSPFTGDLSLTNARELFVRVNGEPSVGRLDDVIDQLHKAPPVPFTSLFTKTDAIVPWQMSVQKGEEGQYENVQLPGSHLGIGVNPLAINVIADRLAQPEGAWQPFEPKGLYQRAYQIDH